MASITTCPRCSSQLGLPADVDAAAQVQCPICEVEFALSSVSPRILPEARVLAHAELAVDEPAKTPTAQERLSRLLQSSAARSSSAAPSPVEEPTESGVDVQANDATARPDTEPAEPINELTPGSSRLDQLLSDLMKTSATAPPQPTPAEPVVAASAVETRGKDAPSAAVGEPLARDFDAELSDLDDAVEEQVAWNPASEAPVEDGASFELRTTPRRQHRPAMLRMLIGIVGGGVVGLLLGAYGLLWFRGADGDFLGLAEWLPQALLPTSMRQMAETGDAAAVNSNLGADAAEHLQTSSTPEHAARSDSTRLDSAVVPATATEPVAEATTKDEESAGAADAPNGASATIWPTTPIVRDLRGMPLYSVAQLSEATTAAEAAAPRLLAGDLARQESWSTMGPAYIALASLAERFTLTDPAAYGSDMIVAQAAAKEVFHSVLGNTARRADLSLIAARWLEHARRQNQGVIAVGRVAKVRPQGSWTEYSIEIPLGPTNSTAAVLTDQTDFAVSDELAVVGAIILNPREHIDRYAGDAQQLIVAGYAISPYDLTTTSETSRTPR